MVSASTIRQDVFTAIRTIIIANKPAYSYNGVTYTYTVVAEYPNTDGVFPCVVINKSNVKLSLINLDGSGEDYAVDCQMDFYAKEAHGKKAIDVAQDALQNTFVGNISTFIATNGLNPMEHFWEDSNSSVFEDGKQVLNTASSIVRFKLK